MIQPDITAILEFWNERAAILEYEAGNNRISAEVIARQETSNHFGFSCIAIVQAERQRLTASRNAETARDSAMALHRA